MEINTYNLRKNHDELKDLSEEQLMCIAELCMDYYKMGLYSTENDHIEDLQEENTELQDTIDCLESEKEDFQDSIDKFEKLLRNCYFSDDTNKVQTEIKSFAELNGYGYLWDWLKDK